MFIAVFFSTGLAFGQNAGTEIDTQKNDIRRICNSVILSNERLEAKIKIDNEIAHLRNLKDRIEEYRDLALVLEEQGKYSQAQSCYAEILNLTSDLKLRAYIKKRNAYLKSLADREKELALASMSEGIKKTRSVNDSENTIESLLKEINDKVKNLEEKRK